ncbi:MAG: RNA-binding transcriptional accessory protein [Kiritimatiellae bacterium]|nr:RNA-binding transcriptional accessory protein [Kiritimatiellia bacterium]
MADCCFSDVIATELNLSPRQVRAVIQLFEEGCTVPFIARYRKEVHGNLDEVQISSIQERLGYHRELEMRRETILSSILQQGKLTDELKSKLLACTKRTELEDLYLPYRPKRRTRAMIAREKGLQPLADAILSQSLSGDPSAEAALFVAPEKDLFDTLSVLKGARDIVAEVVAEDSEVRGFARAYLAKHGLVRSEVVEPIPEEPTKFEQYYDFEEPIAAIPSHRFLALKRGEAEGVLRVSLIGNSESSVTFALEKFGFNPGSVWAEQLEMAVKEAYRRLVAPSIELDVIVAMKQEADRAAVEVFAENLRHLLLQAPLGERGVIGIDPGFRTGCKCVALDATGKFLRHVTIYPEQGQQKAIEATVELLKLIALASPYAIAIGNGTAGRETEQFVRQTLKRSGKTEILVVPVNEAGASVYSASSVAREEFPDLDLTIRGAISIGRRLQDPLAELVKIDPKAIGVGQYQHDVNQTLLASKLDEVVVRCVNNVGVELNTASVPLLTRVSGIGPALARCIVAYRDANGAFRSRDDLLRVPGLGAKSFEQCAGFLRIRDSAHPLDRSAVHPERYALVEQMAADAGVPLTALVGDPAAIARIHPQRYVSATVGQLTVNDILDELRKPGRDPRAVFEPPAFREDVCTIEDVRPGMTLEGIVTNVTAFGAFVDIGVHQDGLVHVSELSDRFVKDPSEVVKAGDKLKVRVLEVDLKRRRISLSARSEAKGRFKPMSFPGKMRGNPSRGKAASSATTFSNNPFAGL